MTFRAARPQDTRHPPGFGAFMESEVTGCAVDRSKCAKSSQSIAQLSGSKCQERPFRRTENEDDEGQDCLKEDGQPFGAYTYVESELVLRPNVEWFG